MNEETQEKSAVVLTRRAGEAIRLGDDVFVRVGQISPEKVKLEGIAPKSVPVHQGEVYYAIRGHLRQRGESR